MAPSDDSQNVLRRRSFLSYGYTFRLLPGFLLLKLLLSADRELLIFLIPFPLDDGGVSYWYFSRMARKAGRLRRIMSGDAVAQPQEAWAVEGGAGDHQQVMLQLGPLGEGHIVAVRDPDEEIEGALRRMHS